MWCHFRQRFKGRKTIYAARLYVLAGLILAGKDYLNLNGVDIINYLPAWFQHSVYWPAVVFTTGMLFEGLRWITNGPPAWLKPFTNSQEPSPSV